MLFFFFSIIWFLKCLEAVMIFLALEAESFAVGGWVSSIFITFSDASPARSGVEVDKISSGSKNVGNEHLMI